MRFICIINKQSIIVINYYNYSSSVKSKEDASSTEEDWDADEKEEIAEEKKESKSKSPKVSTYLILTF